MREILLPGCFDPGNKTASKHSHWFKYQWMIITCKPSLLICVRDSMPFETFSYLSTSITSCDRSWKTRKKLQGHYLETCNTKQVPQAFLHKPKMLHTFPLTQRAARPPTDIHDAPQHSANDIEPDIICRRVFPVSYKKYIMQHNYNAKHCM